MRLSGASGYLRALILASLAVVAGCAGQQHDLLPAKEVAAPAASVARDHHIYIATTRAKAKDPREVFSGQRSRKTAYAMVDVSVPANHKPGRIERPTGAIADPGKYFTVEKISGYRDGEAFSNTLSTDIKAHGGNALVFIHGYNTHFDDAVYRITQIVQDSGYKGAPVLFTWASAGKTVDYVYDTNSATVARDALEETLRLVAKSGAKRIDIVAHSLGNWVTMEALRQLAITKDKDLSGKLGDVVLASPDLDIDVFKSQMERYGKPKHPFIVLISRKDQALDISSWIAGDKPRLGDYLDAKDIVNYGAIVVDLSKVESGDELDHTTFADNPDVIKLLGKGLNEEDARALGKSSDVTSRVNRFARGLSQSMTSAADIVITTPLEVLTLGAGGR
ncbi:alpha/beta hydrolase [Mesorhizobium sp. NPDC059054]|uniref:alpha/beta hydrolase n=1 Tax=Mesorhizobium sp. NPDC059054 TaxID=3346711 RepID=UPI00367E7FE5